MKKKHAVQFSDTRYLKNFYLEIERTNTAETIYFKKSASVGISMCNVGITLEIAKKHHRLFRKT
jgi:hypothetical protein